MRGEINKNNAFKLNSKVKISWHDAAMASSRVVSVSSGSFSKLATAKIV